MNFHFSKQNLITELTKASGWLTLKMIINISKSSYFMVIIMNTYIICVPVSILIIECTDSLITAIFPEDIYISIERNGE